MLLFCVGLRDVRDRALDLWLKNLQDKPDIMGGTYRYTVSDPANSVPFLLYPSMLPDFILLHQTPGHEELECISYLT